MGRKWRCKFPQEENRVLRGRRCLTRNDNGAFNADPAEWATGHQLLGNAFSTEMASPVDQSLAVDMRKRFREIEHYNEFRTPSNQGAQS